MKKVKTIKFLGFNCRLERGEYNNGRLALELVDIKSDEPVAVATVNMPMEALSKDEVVIKNYSENEGILDALIKAKVISQPIRIVQSGYVSSPICKLL
jgi:hypothetical protein